MVDDSDSAADDRVCDLYEAAGVPCVAAHSTVRSLFKSYVGPLYEIVRESDHVTKQIMPLVPGGIADSVEQEEFCEGQTCRVTAIIDQSGRGNDLTVGRPGPGRKNCSDVKPLEPNCTHNCGCKGCEALPPPALCDIGVLANKARISFDEQHAYGTFHTGGMGYHFNGSNSSALPLGDEPETIVAVFGGQHTNGECCFDYGPSETKLLPQGAGAMEALQFGSLYWAGHPGGKGNGTGPWVMADLEHGTWAGNSSFNPKSMSMGNHDFVTAMLKGKSGHFSLKGADAQHGSLQTFYDGPRPVGYTPMVGGCLSPNPLALSTGSDDEQCTL
eukprot:SAG31_NODE_5498_length_2499_cov_15.125833_1_plen_329_part_00